MKDNNLLYISFIFKILQNIGRIELLDIILFCDLESTIKLATLRSFGKKTFGYG